jgi:hypothetical protein
LCPTWKFPGNTCGCSKRGNRVIGIKG